jgi:transcriptional regulator with XRE-family HTH domain
MEVDEATYLKFEQGRQAPTLPQLEVFSYFLQVPIAHFFGSAETLQKQSVEDELKGRTPELLMLRQRIIGVRLKQLRELASLTVTQVAEQTGLREEQILAIEQGSKTLPVNELETLVHAVKGNLDDLIDNRGTIGSWLRRQEEFDALSELPPELRAFVLKPINISYLELAMKLSELDVHRLRIIAESILDITY